MVRVRVHGKLATIVCMEQRRDVIGMQAPLKMWHAHELDAKREARLHGAVDDRERPSFTTTTSTIVGYVTTVWTLSVTMLKTLQDAPAALAGHLESLKTDAQAAFDAAFGDGRL